MTSYVLIKTSTNEVLRYQSFLQAPEQPNPAKDIHWEQRDPPVYIPSAEEVARKEAETAFQTDLVDVRNYPKLNALKGMAPTQIRTWVDANVTNLAEARDAIKTLAIAVSLLARRML